MVTISTPHASVEHLSVTTSLIFQRIKSIFSDSYLIMKNIDKSTAKLHLFSPHNAVIVYKNQLLI